MTYSVDTLVQANAFNFSLDPHQLSELEYQVPTDPDFYNRDMQSYPTKILDKALRFISAVSKKKSIITNSGHSSLALPLRLLQRPWYKDQPNHAGASH